MMDIPDWVDRTEQGPVLTAGREVARISARELLP
jgi:hypothetical protein